MRIRENAFMFRRISRVNETIYSRDYSLYVLITVVSVLVFCVEGFENRPTYLKNTVQGYYHELNKTAV